MTHRRKATNGVPARKYKMSISAHIYNNAHSEETFHQFFLRVAAPAFQEKLAEVLAATVA